MVKLTHKLTMLPTVCKVGEPGCPRDITRMSTIKDALQCLDTVAAAMVSEVRTLVKMYLTVPVTAATSERRFSTLRRLKTYLR